LKPTPLLQTHTAGPFAFYCNPTYLVADGILFVAFFIFIVKLSTFIPDFPFTIFSYRLPHQPRFTWKMAINTDSESFRKNGLVRLIFLTRDFAIKFYRMDALPSTNQQKHTWLHLFSIHYDS